MQEQKFKADEVAIVVNGYTVHPYTESDEYYAELANTKKDKLIKMFDRITVLHDLLRIANEDDLPITYRDDNQTYCITYGSAKKLLIDRYDNSHSDQHQINLVRIIEKYLRKLEYAKELNGQ